MFIRVFQLVLELECLQGFTIISELAVGRGKEPKKGLVKKIGVHQPIRITNCNLSFIFLIGRNGTVMTTMEQILLKCQAQR